VRVPNPRLVFPADVNLEGIPLQSQPRKNKLPPASTESRNNVNHKGAESACWPADPKLLAANVVAVQSDPNGILDEWSAHSAYRMALATREKAPFAWAPISWIVAITIAKTTLSMTAYSATFWPSWVDNNLLKRPLIILFRLNSFGGRSQRRRNWRYFRPTSLFQAIARKCQHVSRLYGLIERFTRPEARAGQVPLRQQSRCRGRLA